jgi:hypothetical protein
MSISLRLVTLSLSLPIAFAVLSAPRGSEAALPESVMAIAAPLAEHYGVSGSAVTSLLENGLSLEGVTQLLLMKESSGKSFGEVTQAFQAQGEDIKKTASQLGVAADKYSAANVSAAIERAKADAAEEATQKTGDATRKAVDSVFDRMPGQ